MLNQILSQYLKYLNKNFLVSIRLVTITLSTILRITEKHKVIRLKTRDLSAMNNINNREVRICNVRRAILRLNDTAIAVNSRKITDKEAIEENYSEMR